ncbi:MAG: universal stress protein [Gemmatimonadota bacterium]
MYKVIMVALADAELDRAALTAGIRLARASAARLHLVHVRVQDAEADFHDVEKRAFLDAATWASDELGESVSFQLIQPRSGRHRARIIAKYLIRYAENEQAGLIVMGTHARSRLGRSILGSVGDELIRGIEVPILLIPRRKGRRELDSLRLRRMLVPLDGTPGAEQILDDAAQFATLVHGSMALLQVIQPEPLPKPYADEIQPLPLAHEEFILRSARSEEYLDRTAEQLGADGLKVETLTLVGGQVTPVIKSAAAIAHVEVIALATGGLPPYALFRQTGIADHLIDDARCALLVRRRQPVGAEMHEPALTAV